VGVDTLDAVAPDAACSTRCKWRGKGLLMIASSRWQFLGYHAGSPAASGESSPAWAVTYFEKTLFTPAGLDIYARTAAGLPEGLVVEIKSGLRTIGGAVAELADQIFEVPRSV